MLELVRRDAISAIETRRLRAILAQNASWGDHSGVTIAATFAEFAAREAKGVSPVYERLSTAVSRDERVLTLLRTLPPTKWQPNLLFGVVRLLGGPVHDPAGFHDYTVANWPAIEAELRTRTVQTNEAGRCAVLLPVLAALPQPLALLEVGASAGLCLYPDRYAYRYGNHVLGSGEPVLDCAAAGVTPPARVPDVVWRAGSPNASGNTMNRHSGQRTKAGSGPVLLVLGHRLVRVADARSWKRGVA